MKSAHGRDALFAFPTKYVIIYLYISFCIRFWRDGLRPSLCNVPRQKGCGLYQSKTRKRRSTKRQTHTQRQLRTEGNALLGGALWQNICYNRTHYTAEFYQIHSRKLTQSCRVVFLTDLHLREYGADNCELVQDVRSLAPDLILLGGDFVTYGEGTNYDNMLSLFRQLSEIAPVCGVLGNHEDELYFLDNDRELVEKFTAAGVTVLRNQEARYTIHDNVISILGVEGSPEDFYNYGASTFMDSVEPQTDYDLRICLAHVPTYFPEHLENYSFELGLAGHTHGGIVRLPKIGPLYTAEEGFFPDYAGGSYTLANNATLIVSRGLGDSSWVPRINNVPELSVIDID